MLSICSQALSKGLEYVFHKLARAENRSVREITHSTPRIVVNPQRALVGDDGLHALGIDPSSQGLALLIKAFILLSLAKPSASTGRQRGCQRCLDSVPHVH